jgi:hypothetical protein
MENLHTAKLRDNLLSIIQRQYEFIQIEKALDDYIDSVESNYDKEIKRLQSLCTELVGMETAYQEGALFFGCHCTIEQKRHGVPNEQYTHKVIGTLQSNTWVDVPVQTPCKETLHNEMADVVLCICEGVDETEARKYRRVDCKSMR